jgi:hypothetical protein
MKEHISPRGDQVDLELIEVPTAGEPLPKPSDNSKDCILKGNVGVFKIEGSQ